MAGGRSSSRPRGATVNADPNDTGTPSLHLFIWEAGDDLRPKHICLLSLVVFQWRGAESCRQSDHLMCRQPGELVVGIWREWCEQHSGAGRVRTGGAKCGLCRFYFWWSFFGHGVWTTTGAAKFAINDMSVK
jgi:hypothetical protein